MSYKWILGCGLLLCALVVSPVRAQRLLIGDLSDSPTDVLAFDILKLALSKSAPEVEFELVPGLLHRVSWEEALKQGQLSVMWAGTTLRLERELLPIRIPVFKGLLGYRIFIIHKDDQLRFNQIRSLTQLRTLVAGSGTAWGDTFILRANNLPLKLAPGNHQLLSMLERREIDYFPRALTEPWGELQQFGSTDLAVEQHLLLVYPYPLYFFVAPGNQQLHDQIHRGLEMAIEDGSFDALFFGAPAIKDILTKAKLGERTVLRLINPYLSPETPFYREEFWLDPDSL